MDAMRRVLGLAGLVLFFGGPAQAQSPDALGAAQLLVGQGAYADAAARLEAVAPEALTPDGAFLLGRCYQALLRHDEAVVFFQQADTTRPAVLAGWAQSLERLGLADEAEARYEAAYRQDSTNQAVAASLARLYAERNRWGDVLAIYTRLLEAEDDNSFIYAQLGTAYARLDSVDQAIVHYEIAHGLNPRSVRVVLALTKVYYDVGFFLSAKRVVDRALAQRPRSPDLWRRRGEIALKEEAYDVAEDAFAGAVAFGDSAALDLRNLGVSRFFRGRFEEADTVLTASFARDSTDAMGAFYLGAARQQRQRYDEALYYLNYAADLLNQPLLADIHARIGNTHDLMDQDGEAIRAYRLAQTLAPERPELLVHLAALYDGYYADRAAVLEGYERFLGSVGEGALPQMESYAQRRVRELREERFFRPEATRPADEAPAVLPPDSTGGGGR